MELLAIFRIEDIKNDALQTAARNLAGNGDRRRRFGVAGHRRAAERFSWERERADLQRLLGLEAVFNPALDREDILASGSSRGGLPANAAAAAFPYVVEGTVAEYTNSTFFLASRSPMNLDRRAMLSRRSEDALDFT